MQKTFLFYDLETTGLDKSYDQVQQFAAIRTDLELNELERHEIFVKINPDVLPSPQALIIHRVGIEQCQSLGLNEYEAIGKIHELLNTSNTISIGYNTLGFDDEFLRFSFHRNLLSPYTHQYANGCARADLYPMAAMMRWQQADCLTWPSIDGKPTLKLEHISSENKLAEGQAHNAIVDVEATIALAKCFQQSEATWNYLLGFFDKHCEQKRLRKLPNLACWPEQTCSLLVDGNFGGKNNYQCPALLLGPHNVYKNQILWLKLDQPELTTLNQDNLASLPWVIRKKNAESPFFLPNKDRFMAKLSSEQHDLYQNNINFLQENPKLLEQLKQHYQQRTYPELPGLPAQAALYQSAFLSREDSQQCQRFHKAAVAQKAKSIEGIKRADLKHLATLIMARHYPEHCSKSMLQLLEKHQQMLCHSADILNHQGKTKANYDAIQKALHECYQQPIDQQQKQLLDELRTYLSSLNKAEQTA
jgi:exodeoxyribonuclease I